MIKTLTIGNVELPNRYVLAPMAGVTDLPFVVMQGTGSRASVHGNDQCKGAPV